MLENKEKSATGPKNFAMAKVKMLKEKAQAKVEGRLDVVKVLVAKMSEIEATADR